MTSLRCVSAAGAAALLLSVAVGSGAAVGRPLAASAASGSGAVAMNCKLGTKNCIGGSGPVRCGGKLHPCQPDSGLGALCTIGAVCGVAPHF